MRFLSACVMGYVGLLFIVAAIPGLSKLVHVSLAATILGLLVVMGGRKIRFPAEPVIGVMWVLTLYAWGSVLWSGNEGAAFARAAGIVVSVTGATVIWLALWAGVSKYSVLIAATVGASIQAGVALYQYLLFDAERATGLTGNANSLATELSVAALLGLVLVTNRRFLQAVVAMGLVIVATVVSGSRQIIAVWGGLLLLASRSLGAKLRNSAVLLGAVLLLVPFVSIGLTTTGGVLVNPLLEPIQQIQVYDRFESLASGHDNSTLTRIAMIGKAIELWRESPIWGHGIDQFRYLSGFDTYAHNNYAELIATLGIVGFLMYYAVLGTIVVRASRRLLAGQEHAWPVLVICVVIVFWDLVLVSFTSRLFWLVYAVLLYHLATGHRPEESPETA